jgi:hypothetical protein
VRGFADETGWLGVIAITLGLNVEQAIELAAREKSG